MSQELLAGSRQQAHPATRASYRPEVQGLRALAVLMVVTYHVWFGRVSGGVDIFLLISAFLLTLSFVRKVEAGKALDLGRYWLHLFKRLLPAVVVVILAVLAATALFVPRSRWTAILDQAWSSLLYFQNWVLAANSVDYYAADQSVASPLQHFWSLSVQGQVFILWPILFALAALVARATGIRYRRVVLMVFGTLFAVSLAFSIHETYTNQVHAYFDTRTRLWEFAFGTLLALALPYLKLPRPLRIAAGWVGLAAMLSGGFILDVQGQFPGYVALWPLVAAALVIVAGQTGSVFGADRFLSWKPLIRLGDMSYALYLWHWPILVIYLIWRGREEVGLVGGAGIIALSLVLAYLTTKFVERPLRSMAWADAKKRRAGVVVAVCLALVAGPVLGWQQALRAEVAQAEESAARNNPGARALVDGYSGEPAPDAPVLPLLSSLGSEWGTLDGDCSPHEDAPTDPLLAGPCMATSSQDYEKTILVLGDSHSQQWLGAIKPMAQERNYRVMAVLLGACPFGAPNDARRAECNDFNEAVLSYAKELRPDAVLAVGTAADPVEPVDTVVAGLPDASMELAGYGIPVIGIRDNPRFPVNMIQCAESHGVSAAECTVPLAEKLSDPAEMAAEFDSIQGLALLDMSDLICPEGTCLPTVGNVFVYMDSNHLTATYTASMGPEFDRRFHAAVHW
ncbi:acyltransferase family protein [Arthrobacter sp. Helios]|uniref:acyltransferase family protein n=1 Tax=Arthrobacter sp. Helios TaxID=2828862 RepID=UPI00204ABC1A|nr:acyltransferase family protein [Arthrobacter sp. Helios]UPO75598.1 acyltransferase [Arthrobacter sp. Helios]